MFPKSAALLSLWTSQGHRMLAKLAALLFLWTSQVDGFRIPITVKETLDISCSTLLEDCPFTVVVPFAKGQLSSESSLAMEEGNPIQAHVLERWLGDSSIRHVMIHFQETLDEAISTKTLHLVNTGGGIPTQPVSVEDSTEEVTVDTGKIKFKISKNSFNLIDQLWHDENTNGSYEASELRIDSDSQNGARFVPRTGAGEVQFSSQRSDVTVEIEESGPLRVVVKVEAPTHYVSTTDHTHGFAVRFYAYAGGSQVKIDYQLRNSAMVVASWPLYFDELTLDLDLQFASTPSVTVGGVDGTTRVSGGVSTNLRQDSHSSYKIIEDDTVSVDKQNLDYDTVKQGAGFLNIQSGTVGVMASIRNFWQTNPNGLSVVGDSELSIELFPSWSKQYTFDDIDTSLYWLDDMQHVLKEVYLFFHSSSPSSDELMDLAQTFQYAPIASVGTAWYQETKATFDFDGLLPPSIDPPQQDDTGSPDEHWKWDAFVNTGSNWVGFGDPGHYYRLRPCTTGSFPLTAEQFVARQDSSLFYLYETWIYGEINNRPQWLPAFVWASNQSTLQLTENPYCGRSWRQFLGHHQSFYDEPPLYAVSAGYDIGTPDPNFGPRDNQHGWFYHVADSYWYNGNSWVKDWYKFIGQFRRGFLQLDDPWPDLSSRSIGHAVGHALQAARVAGDVELRHHFAHFFRSTLLPARDALYGSEFNSSSPSLGGGFQTGYLSRAIINWMTFVQDEDVQLYAELFNYLSGIMEWNRLFGNFPYYYHQYKDTGTGSSSGTGLTLIDPQAWYFHMTGKQVYWDHLELFVSSGINGGERPYGDWNTFRADGWGGKMYAYVKQVDRSDKSPPLAINDLSATYLSGTMVKVAWSTPSDAVRVHVVWSDKPVVEDSSIDPTVTNWWAANAVGVSGTPDHIEVSLGQDPTGLYFAAFCFDGSNNMSPISNVVQVNGGQPIEPTPPVSTPTTPTPPVTAPVSIPTPTGQPIEPTPPPSPSPPVTAPVSAPTSTGDILHIYAALDSFEAAVEAAYPGLTIIVHEGQYEDTGRISIGVQGTASNPVIIRGAAGESRPQIVRPTSANPQNTINIEGSSHLTIQGLQITSNGGDGIKIGSDLSSDHISLIDLVIFDVAVGINAQTDVDELLVRNCEISHTSGTGEGLYLGQHDGLRVVTNSVIEYNWIHHTNSASVTQGDGIELKTNSYGNTIRHNVIHDTAFPCIFLYGSGGGSRNIVEQNVMWNCGQGGIQVVADSIVRNNIILDSYIGINSNAHSVGVSPDNLEIVHNTVVGCDICLNIRNWNGKSDIIFANNAVYCSSDTMDWQGGTDSVQVAGNVFFPGAAAFPTGSYTTGRSIALDFVAASSLDVYPTSDSALRSGHASGYVPATDFDGSARGSAAEVGAYEWSSAGRQWVIQSGFKPHNGHPTPPVAPPVPVPVSPPVPVPVSPPVPVPVSPPAPVPVLPPVTPPLFLSPPPDRPSCFSAKNTVEVLGRGLVSMDSIQVGDQVLADHGQFSVVYTMGHQDHQTPLNFLQLHLEHSPEPLEVSHRHLLLLDNGIPIEARSIRVGDNVSGSKTVEAIHQVHRRGVYAPITQSGRLKVSGVLVSSYVSLVDLPPWMQDWMAHIGFAPIRLWCSWSSCRNERMMEGYSWSTYVFIQCARSVDWLPTFLKVVAALLLLIPSFCFFLVEHFYVVMVVGVVWWAFKRVVKGK